MSTSTSAVHKVHPSVYNMAAAGNVANSPFLRYQQQGPPPKASEEYKTKPKEEQQLSKMHSTQQSVYVLDKAKLAEQGIDFWENSQAHSRVNTEWWLAQLRQRQLIKQQQADTSASKRENTVGKKKQSIARSDEDDDDSDVDDVEESVVEQSVIYHDQETPRHEVAPTVLFGGAVEDDTDLNEEFESLLKDYRDASVRLLHAESEKKQTMLVLNEQKEMIDVQSQKMQELQRQLDVFESTLQKIDDSTVNNHELIEKFEQSLASDAESKTDEHYLMRVDITKAITQKVNEDFDRKLELNELELGALRQRLQEKDDIEARLKRELETRQNATNEQLLAITQQLQQTQQQNQELVKAVSDLKHEVEQQQTQSPNQNNKNSSADDASMQQHNVVINNHNNYALNHADHESARKLLNGHNAHEPDYSEANDDDGVPLLADREKQFGKTPRKDTTKKYIGLPPKEFFLKNKWCCGFVCCDSACGCGAY